MPIPLRLEVFPADQPESDPLQMTAADLESVRQAAYEEGYAAGWEDAQTQAVTDSAARQTLAEEALQALSFTHAEARAHVIAALRPLITAMAQTILPGMAQQALVALIADEVDRMVRDGVEAPLTLICSPAVRDTVERVCRRVPTLPILIIEEPGFSPAELRLRCADEETEIDIDAAIAAVQAAVAAHFSTSTELFEEQANA